MLVYNDDDETFEKDSKTNENFIFLGNKKVETLLMKPGELEDPIPEKTLSSIID